MCGENRAASSGPRSGGGSSPRVRGKPFGRVRSYTGAGLIPACAGKTGHLKSPGGGHGAHPRVCGENKRAVRLPSVASGSSPRVRGKRLCSRHVLCLCGLIPACAGKTSGAQTAPTHPKAHPRVCGENESFRPSHERSAGSSPRVRGKPKRKHPDSSHNGLIPACAGKTWCGCLLRRLVRAHPRVCGENSKCSGRCGSFLGSSPRVRGKPPTAPPVPVGTRLIPACAGKTLNSHTRARRAGAHPRVCGENSFPAARGRYRGGSSPRVRGKLLHTPNRNPQKRLIPACAGKTKPLKHPTRPTKAHPRVCGENGYAVNEVG